MAAQIPVSEAAGGDCRRGCGPHCCFAVVTLTGAAVVVVGIVLIVVATLTFLSTGV